MITPTFLVLFSVNGRKGWLVIYAWLFFLHGDKRLLQMYSYGSPFTAVDHVPQTSQGDM